MSIYIGLGKYSNNGAEGLIDGSSDRRAAMGKLTKSVGAKLIVKHPNEKSFLILKLLR